MAEQPLPNIGGRLTTIAVMSKMFNEALNNDDWEQAAVCLGSLASLARETSGAILRAIDAAKGNTAADIVKYGLPELPSGEVDIPDYRELSQTMRMALHACQDNRRSEEAWALHILAKEAKHRAVELEEDND